MKIRFVRDTDLIDGNFNEVFYPKYEELEIRDIGEDSFLGSDQISAYRVSDDVFLILNKEDFEIVKE